MTNQRTLPGFSRALITLDSQSPTPLYWNVLDGVELHSHATIRCLGAFAPSAKLVPLKLSARERELILEHTFADDELTAPLRVVPISNTAGAADYCDVSELRQASREQVATFY